MTGDLGGGCRAAVSQQFVGSERGDATDSGRGVETDWKVADQREAVHQVGEKSPVVPVEVLDEVLHETQVSAGAGCLENRPAMRVALSE